MHWDMRHSLKVNENTDKRKISTEYDFHDTWQSVLSWHGGDERRDEDIMTKITHDLGTTIKDTFDTFGTRPTKKYNYL